MLALGSLRLRIFRHCGLGSLASASFDTLAWVPSPPRRSTRWRWAPSPPPLVVDYHLVWFVTGPLRRLDVRVAIGGLLRGDWACHVIRGLPGHRGERFGSFASGRVVDVAWVCRGGRGENKWSVMALET